MVKAVYFNRFSAIVGANFKAFSVGFSVDKYSAAIDLGFVWIAVEW